MKKVEVLSNGRVRVLTENTGPSKVQQQFKDMTDVNKIIKRYLKTGDISHLSKRRGVYADFSGISDYQAAMQTVLEANTKFMELPAELRKRFGNDPKQLLEYLSDERNRKESIALGLRLADPVVESQESSGPNPGGPPGQGQVKST